LAKIFFVPSGNHEHAAGGADPQRQEAGQLISMWQQDSLSAWHWFSLPAQFTPVASSGDRRKFFPAFFHPQQFPSSHSYCVNLMNGGSSKILPQTEFISDLSHGG